MEHKTVNEKFKLQRTVCGINGHFVVQGTLERSTGTSFIRQCYNSGDDKWNGRFVRTVRYGSKVDSYRGYGGQYNAKREISGRNFKLESGLSFASKVHIRVASTPKFIQTDRQNLGTTSYRQVRFDHVNSNSSVQFPVLGSANVRSRRVITNKLGNNEQFCESTIRAHSKNSEYNQRTKGGGNINCTKMGRSTLVSTVNGHVNRSTNKTTNITQDDNCSRSAKGTVQKQSVEHLRLENLWSARLRCSGWSRRAARQTIHSIADSTLRSYNSYVEKYVLFCKTNNQDFTEEHNISALADFLCQIADSSTRPESCIKSTLAAVSFYFEGLGKPSPAYNSDIKRLTTALIKSGTVKPMSRQKPMPISAFYQLFHLLGDNEKLSMKSLRLKTVTLLALVLMTRPSDLAPKAKLFDPQSMTSKSVVLSVDDIHFNDQGSVTITFWGIKNDTQRQGFEVSIPPSSDIVMDPVSCLRTYIAKTEQYRKSPDNPLLISLKAPYKAISADTVGSILEESIKMAGLGDQGFTAKSFRPTGATIAVSQGILPETVMKIGRWKTKEVFLNHYVYGQVPSGFTTNLLSKDS